MAKREETVRGMGPSPEETAAALDAFIELATEEIAALRRDYRALEENLERSVKAHAGVLRGLEADVRAIKARPEVMPSNFVTKTALERTLLVQAEALTARLEEAVKEAAAHQDPLGAFRAKMRGGL